MRARVFICILTVLALTLMVNLCFAQDTITLWDGVNYLACVNYNDGPTSSDMSLAVQLEVPLGFDQVDQFVNRLDVGGFQMGLSQRAATFGLGRADQRGSRCGRFRVKALADLYEPLGIHESGQVNLVGRRSR